MSDYDKYVCKTPIPKEEDHAYFYVYKKGTTVQSKKSFEELKMIYNSNTVRELRQHFEDHGLVFEEEVDINSFIEAKKELAHETNRLMTQFADDLAREHDVEHNPKRGMLFNKAWGLGHSAGLQEVASYYSDLVELIR